MIPAIIDDKVLTRLKEVMGWSSRRFDNLDHFYDELRKWYNEFYHGDASMGYSAEKLGLNTLDLRNLLDDLGWPIYDM